MIIYEPWLIDFIEFLIALILYVKYLIYKELIFICKRFYPRKAIIKNLVLTKLDKRFIT